MIGLSLIDQAILFATRAHQGQMRKASDTPYISHPFGVGVLLLQNGCEESLVAAGLLHDTLEDTDTTEEELSTLFGDDLLILVKGCSEPDKSLSWEERKTHTISSLKHASIGVCLVTCADKLHNLKTLYEDRKQLGDAIWERFARDYDHQKWYYTSVTAVLKERIGEHPLYKQLEEEVTRFFR